MSKPSYARSHGLTQQQLNAIECILVGTSDVDTSKKVGVARETITRWRLYDTAFRAELDRYRFEIWEAAIDTVRATLPQAARTLYHQLQVSSTRGRLALDFLTRAGLLGKPYSGSLGAFPDPGTDEVATPGAAPHESQIVTHDHDESATRP